MLDDFSEIEYNEDCMVDIKECVSKNGQVRLIIEKKYLNENKKIIFNINSLEIDQLGMQFNPRIIGIEKNVQHTLLKIQLVEYFQ